MSNTNDESERAPDRPLKRMPVLWLAGLFIVVVCVSIISIDLWQLQQSRAHELAQANISASNLSKSLAQQADDTLDEADLVLTGLLERLAYDGGAEAQVPRLHDFLKARVASLEQLQGLFIYDKNGNWTVTSFDSIPEHANNSDREYFHYHQMNTDLAAHIGRPIRSRSTGDWIIPLSRRINDAQGNFNGVVLATIKVDYFDSFFDRFDIDANGSIVLALSDGTILARRPKVSGLTGTSLAKGQLFSELLKTHHDGTAMVTSVVDNVRRLMGYRQLDTYPLVVIAAISEDSILDSWMHYAWRSVAIIVAVVIGNILFGVLLFQQIRFGLNVESRLRIARNSLEKLALQDSLTGLANRRHFQEILSIEFDPGLRLETPLSLIMIDIDFFKSYNDTYGHVAGDKCIAQVAACISNCLNRPGDLAVRYGGEELAVFLPFGDTKGVYALAEKIRLAILDREIVHIGNPLGRLSISLGVYSCLRGECPSMETFVERADSALYAAKHGGRNRTEVYGGA